MRSSCCLYSLSLLERCLWGAFVCTIALASVISRSFEPLTVAASLIGVTAFLFNAKGNVGGQVLAVVFSLLYGIVSLHCRYDDEMIPYLGMSIPIARVSVYTWCKHPCAPGCRQVAAAELQKRQVGWMVLLTALVTAAFYFILAYFHTANLFMSTVSVATSFVASYLTALRSPYYALGYAANDIVLILLWTSACMQNPQYVSMVVCFALFLCNDLYGFYSWQRRRVQPPAHP